MKLRNKVAITCITILVLVLSVPVFAAPDYNYPELPRIIDNAGILSSSEKYDKVNELITMIAEKYRLDAIVLTEPDSDYDRRDFNGITYYDNDYDDYLVDYYESGGDFERVETTPGYYTGLDGKATYGIGNENSGLIIGLDLAGGRRGDANFMIVTRGRAEHKLPMNKLDLMIQYYRPLLQEGKYYDALIVALEGTIDILENRLQLRSFSLKNVGIAFLATGVIAGIITLGIALSMSNVSKSSYAGNYLVQDSFNLRATSDIYTHTTTTRTKISSESNRSGGGSSSGGGGISSSGSSFGSSGTRF